MIMTNTMAGSESVSSKTNELAITPRDILFACPSCGKNLVVDEAAEGMIVHCPQCKTAVIVPPKPAPTGPPSSIESKSVVAAEKKPPAGRTAARKAASKQRRAPAKRSAGRRKAG